MSPRFVALRLFGSIAAAGAASAAIAVAASGSGMAMAADRAHPTVVELFQSQGCSSCPPANANVIALADRPDVLALSFQVTYWDNLGWKDTFGTPANTDRQWDYARAWKRAQVATPQVVIDGRRDLIGSNRAELEQALRAADRGRGPAVDIAGDSVTVSGPAAGRSADVWLVRFDPNVVQVPIRRGENEGLTLPHKNVVREIVRLGDWSGAAKRFALPPGAPGLKSAVLVQAGRGGPILAAART